MAKQKAVWVLNDATAEAHTKSEARAIFKSRFIPKVKRLPVGVKIERKKEG
jgi:hypothetical protein